MANPERLERYFARERLSARSPRRAESNWVPGDVRSRQTGVVAPADGAREALVAKLALVKQTRFNAAKRLEAKHDVGQLALAIAGIYGFLIPLFTLQFKGTIIPSTVAIIDFVAVLAGVLSFAMGFLYQERDYKGRAARLHRCALEINQLRNQLETTIVSDVRVLQDFVKRYSDILAANENHDDIDFKIALEQQARFAAGANTAAISKRLAWLELRCFLSTHGLSIAIWIVPPLIGVGLWLLLPSTH